MRDIDRVAHVLAITELTARLQTDMRRLTKALREAQAWPSSGSGERVSTSNIANPTEQMAMGPDPARATLDQLDKSLVRVLGECRALESMRTTWLRQHQPAKPTQAQPDANAGCSFMARVGTWEPVHRTSDCGGVLPAPTPVGRWCYDFIRATGRVPTQGECERHARGLHVKVAVPNNQSVVRL